MYLFTHLSMYLFTSSRNMSNLDKLKAKTTLGKLYADHLMRYVSHSFIHLIHQSHPSHPSIHPSIECHIIPVSDSISISPLFTSCYLSHSFIHLTHPSTSSIHFIYPSIECHIIPVSNSISMSPLLTSSMTHLFYVYRSSEERADGVDQEHHKYQSLINWRFIAASMSHRRQLLSQCRWLFIWRGRQESETAEHQSC